MAPLKEWAYSLTPDRILMLIDGADIQMTEEMARTAVSYAQSSMPKISGHLSASLKPAFGENYWGIYFPDKRAWYLEKGTNPFTMNSLAGKIIPMWVDDPDGSVAKDEGRKAQTRITVDGRHQTKIFRRAARKGQRKMVEKNGRLISVPMSYPGAAGRISSRGGQGRISSGNVGVRWRHPGIGGRDYLNNAMFDASIAHGVDPEPVFLVDDATFSIVTRS
jgi:hypothetical protein